MKLYSILLVILIFLSPALKADSLDDFINNRQELVKLCLKHIDYDAMKLPAAKKATEAGNYRTALLDIVNYYKDIDRTTFFDYPKATPVAIETADMVLNGKLTIMNINGKFVQNSEGLIDWDGLVGTNDEQWPGLFSRHLYMFDLLSVYRVTSNQEYIDTLNSHLYDFISQAKSPMKNLQPDKVSWAIAAPETWHKIDETTVVSRLPKWYTLNAAIRIGTWLKLFYGMQDIDGFEDTTRAVLLVSLFEHCNYVRWHHRGDGNWKIGEMKALIKAAICIPEFTTSTEWLTYSMGQLSNELDSQVYPDGVQKELCASYHRGVLNGYVQIENIFERSGRSLPLEFSSKMQRMYEYLAFSSRNGGYAPLNNDSDKDYVAPMIRKAAAKYSTDELQYVTSFGQKGSWNRAGYSIVFDYAGQAIFRNGYSKDSDWSYFEIGPWGIGHQHNDKLHISLAAGGRDLLVDGGRYTYNGYHDLSDIWRNYFTSSFSHNVILIDGGGQSGYAKEVDSPIGTSDYYICDDFSFARGTFDAGYNGLKDRYAGKVQGNVSHTRNIVYVNNIGWIVVDHIDTDRPRTIEALWHFHPECSVKVDGGNIFTIDEGKANLLVKPLGEIDFDIEVVSGSEQPQVQGWYSVRFGKKEANDTVTCKAQIQGPTTFCWLLLPFKVEKDNMGASAQSKLIAQDVMEINFNKANSCIKVIVPVKKGRAKVSIN